MEAKNFNVFFKLFTICKIIDYPQLKFAGNYSVTGHFTRAAPRLPAHSRPSLLPSSFFALFFCFSPKTRQNRCVFPRWENFLWCLQQQQQRSSSRTHKAPGAGLPLQQRGSHKLLLSRQRRSLLARHFGTGFSLNYQQPPSLQLAEKISPSSGTCSRHPKWRLNVDG